MIYFDAVIYFEDIARKLKAVRHSDANKHFFRASNVMQLQELIASLSIAQYPAIVVFDKRDGRFEDNQSNNLIDRQYHQVLVLKPANGESSDSRRAAVDECSNIVNSIISRMTRDWLEAQRMNDTTGLRNLDRSTMYYNTVGPLLDNLFGLELAFTLKEVQNTKFVADDWDE